VRDQSGWFDGSDWLRLTSSRDRNNLGSTHMHTELVYSTESEDVGAWHFTMEDVLGPY
jgi:hypothetical protein